LNIIKICPGVLQSPETGRAHSEQYESRSGLRSAKHFYFKCFALFAILNCSALRLIQFRLFSVLAF